MDSNKHHPFISSYVHKGTGRITTNPFGFHQAESLVDEAAEDIFQELGATGIHCYRDVHTGEVSSETARVHRHGGGFAVAKRQRMLPGQEEDGRSVFAHTEMKTIHHGLKHIFRCNGDQNHAASAIHQGTAPDEEMQIDQAMAPEEENQAFDPTPTIARSGRRIYTRRMRRKKEKELKLSDSDKLAESINIQTQNIVRLSRESAHNPHIRVYHTYRKGRTFAYATAFLKSERGPQAIISVLWETRTNPRRGVTTTFSISSSSESLTAHCSCDYLITQTKGSSPNCYHAQTLFNNQDFVDRITREITRRQQHPEARYERCVFGDEIDLGQVRDSSPFLTVVLRREESMQRNVKKPWLFFMVLDIRLQLFVPVVKNAQKSLECQGCRLSSVMGSNCCHVVACIAACKKLRNSGGWYRFLD